MKLNTKQNYEFKIVVLTKKMELINNLIKMHFLSHRLNHLSLQYQHLI